MRGVHGAVLGVLLSLPVPAAQQSTPLEFIVLAPDTVARGDMVPITLQLRNRGDRPAQAYFLGRTITFDIVVRRRGGATVWSRLGDAAVPSILQTRTLAPGEQLEWHDAWRAAESGRYEIQGVLPSDDPQPRRTAWRALIVR